MFEETTVGTNDNPPRPDLHKIMLADSLLRANLFDAYCPFCGKKTKYDHLVGSGGFPLLKCEACGIEVEVKITKDLLDRWIP